jgi:uncharacterized protein (DUF302 family)
MTEQNEIRENKKSSWKYWVMFAAGILWGVAATSTFGVIILRHSLINEYKSKLGFKETVAQLANDIKSKKGWLVRTPSCSLPNPKDGTHATAIKLCNGAYASELMNDESARKTAAMIPCTFAVYQKSDGKTYISRLNVSIIGSLLGGRANLVFSGKVAPDQEKILDGIIE